MRVLLVYPKFPTTFWGFQHALRIVGKRATLPPLGLVTLAAHLPATWELRLVDLNVEPLADADLDWAETVFVGGMRIQGPSIHEVITRAHARGKVAVVGGPAPTTSPEEYGDADLVFRGEAEGRVASLVAAVEAALAPGAGGRGPVVLDPHEVDERPSLAEHGLVPRFELLDLQQYTSLSLQVSRGCPFSCEFCDIIEMFGRIPRLKTPAQVLAELDALYALGWRGTVFFVDDNFIGNRREVRTLLPEVAAWQRRHGEPFELYTEASVNLAADEKLVRAMVEAGFSSVFLGIETPSTKALSATNKRQNTKQDLGEVVASLTRAGLEVMAGFIVGFDEDPADACELQREFIAPSPIPLAMVGLLMALPETALWRRLEREGRLRETVGNGDQFARPNFVPRGDEVELLRGYAELLADLYSPEAYYQRCEAYLDQVGRSRPSKRPLKEGLTILARAALHIGVLSPRRGLFWRLLARSLWRAPHTFPAMVALAIRGEHMIRYTAEDVLPRLAAALREVELGVAPPLAPRRDRAREAALVPLRRPAPAATAAE